MYSLQVIVNKAVKIHNINPFESHMIVDFHTHIFPSDIRTKKKRFFSNEPAFKLLYESDRSKMVGAQELIKSMDQQGVDKSVVFGFPWCNSELIQYHNDYVINAVKAYPDRLIGLCCFDMDFNEAEQEILRCVDAGLSGVGELASYTKPIDQILIEKLAPVMTLCEKNALPLLLHANEPVGHNYPGKAPDSLSGVYQIVSSFPQNIIVLAHWGGGLFFYSLMKKEVKEKLTNVFFDTAASPFLYHKKIYSLARDLIGVEKILFGSDFPLIKPERYFKELEHSGLNASELSLLKGGNAARLFNLV